VPSPSTPYRPGLPVGFRGYDRAATDAFLAELDEHQATVARERDELRGQVDELVEELELHRRELEHHRGRSRAVAEAMVTAQQVADRLKAAGEAEIEQRRREVAAERTRLVEEGATIKAEARQEATEIIREARIRADRLIEEVVSALEEYQRDTDQFLAGTRQRLSSLVRDLLGRIPGSAPDYVPAPAEQPGDDADAPAARTAVA
jgi:cell division septum initiation protein DivIVA